MKNKITAFICALILVVVLIPGIPAAHADTGEKAWFPLSVMKINQIAYESYSHGKINAIDCSGSEWLFAPFTGKIVKVSLDYTTTYFQSNEKVHFANGKYDYMTVQLEHGSNYQELVDMKGKTIKQGTNFYKVGRVGEGGVDNPKYGIHYEIRVMKGHVTSYNDSKAVYAFDAFYINQSKTKTITNQGNLDAGNVIKVGGIKSYEGKWKYLSFSAASKLALKDIAYPSALKQGQAFTVKGSVASNYYITSVKVGIYSKSGGKGTKATEATASPYITSYNLAKIDSKVLFDAVPAGTWYYYITATDASGKVVVEEHKYTVGNNASSLAISGVTYPTALKKGQTYNVKGTVSSNYKITSVRVGIYSQEGGRGTKATEATASPNAMTYNLANIDAKVLFDAVPVGTWYYFITAKDASGKVKSEEHKYTVGNNVSTLAISGVTYPTSLKKGQAYNVKGSVSSNYKITSVRIGIYSQEGGKGTKATEATASPNATSYNLANIDAKVLFDVVPIGTWYYYITATDSSGKVVSKEYKYTVTK